MDVSIIKIDLHLREGPAKAKDCESVTVTGEGILRKRKYRVHHAKNCKWTKEELE